MLLDAALHGPVPEVLVALTLKVYAVPVVRPLTVTGDAAPVPVMHPGVDVAVYVNVAGTPQAGAVNATDADVPEPETTVAVPIVGAPGAVGHSP